MDIASGTSHPSDWLKKNSIFLNVIAINRKYWLDFDFLKKELCKE